MTMIPAQLATRRLWMDLFDGTAAAAMPRTNIKEKKDAYVVETELPGVKKEDIALICERGVLTITAKADEAKDTEEARYIRKERPEGEIVRRFALQDIQEDSISAKLENGVLTVTLPKLKPQEIRIDIE